MMKNVLEQRVRNMEDAVVTLPASRNLTVIASNLSRTTMSFTYFNEFFCFIFLLLRLRFFYDSNIQDLQNTSSSRTTSHLDSIATEKCAIKPTRYLVVYSTKKKKK